MRTLATVSLLLAAAAAAAADRTREVDTRDALLDALRTAQPGDRIEIAPGTYAGGLHASGVRGTEEQPIVVAAADPEHRPVFEGGTSGMQLSECAWLVLEDLVLRGATGNGLNIDDGGTAATPAVGITLRRLTIEDVGPYGNRDGIKLSGVTRFRVESCVLERWGTGGSGIDMVGCHDGVISGCTFRHEGGMGANGVQAKGGTSRVRIERSRFEDAGSRAIQLGGSTGRAYFRPALSGEDNVEARDLVVTGCTILGSDAAVSFVGSLDCTFRRNTIYRPQRWVLRILQETRADDFAPCARGRFEENLVVWRDGDLHSTVNVGPGTEPETFVFARNWWWHPDAPEGSRPRLPVPEQDGIVGRDPLLADPAGGDVSVRPDSPAVGVGAHATPGPDGHAADRVR